MTKHLTLLLFIGLAWGQIKVKSQFDLKPFTVSGLNISTSIKWENGKMIKDIDSGEKVFSGSYECIDNDCSLSIKYDSGKSKEITNSSLDFLEDGDEKEFLSEWLNSKPEQKELTFDDIDEVVKALSELMDYSFGANEKEAEYELSNGSIKRSIKNDYTVNISYQSVGIGDGVQFLNGLKGWQNQHPNKNELKRSAEPERELYQYDEPVLKSRLRPKIPSSYNGEEGLVTLMVKISEKGRVDSVEVFRGVNDILDSLAIKTIKKTKWRPAKARGKKVSAWTTFPIYFRY